MMKRLSVCLLGFVFVSIAGMSRALADIVEEKSTTQQASIAATLQPSQPLQPPADDAKEISKLSVVDCIIILDIKPEPAK